MNRAERDPGHTDHGRRGEGVDRDAVDDATVVSRRRPVEAEPEVGLEGGGDDDSDDVTRISARPHTHVSEEPDDATRLSPRRRPGLAAEEDDGAAPDDATRLAARRSGVDDESTRLASRHGSLPAADEATQFDVPAHRGARHRPLPPGRAPAITAPGAFGTTEPAYAPRRLNAPPSADARADEAHLAASHPDRQEGASARVLAPAEAARRRERERRRRLMITLVGTAIGAAVATAAVIATVWIVAGS
ncbi:hypothetical protein [Demequina aestuarii]|uniref:hypothetical protein n=1 Tax=Demequina aestuarii TaxID=327095 RepID=UPI000782FB5C|nr:hypothetical protein [Demequina aestuarii]